MTSPEIAAVPGFAAFRPVAAGARNSLTLGFREMVHQPKVVAILVDNPALSSILTMVLAAVPKLRVRPFESPGALATYMRLAPVHLVVADFDSCEVPADRLARELGADPALAAQDFQVIALASAAPPERKAASIAAGIDEIIIKPMSPKYLLERVLSRLERRAAARPLAPRFSGNVVPLFDRRPPPPLH